MNSAKRYNTDGECILDVIYNIKRTGVTQEEISYHLMAVRPSIRRTLGKILNRINCKKYILRKKINCVWHYYPVLETCNPPEAYKDIMSSEYKKVTANMIGFKNSTKELPYDYLVCENVIESLREHYPNFISVEEIAKDRGVDHTKGKSTIKSELQRILSCKIQIIEEIEENGVKKYRLISKLIILTVPEIKELASITFGMRNDTINLSKTQKDWMGKNGASYVSSFVKNPSKPQVELYNRVKELYPTAEINYPIRKINKCLDVAIPNLKIWFESDGSYWHQDKEKDSERQKKVEELGWTVIRYEADYIKDVPSKNQIKEDVDRCQLPKQREQIKEDILFVICK